MRKIISRFTSSFSALLTESQSSVDISHRTEEIRSRMLYALRSLQSYSPQTWKAIEQAKDIQSLWFLRTDLFRALSTTRGQNAAKLTVDKITKLFRGVVPKNQLRSTKR